MSDINMLDPTIYKSCARHSLQIMQGSSEPDVPILINKCLLGQRLQRLRLTKTIVRCKNKQRPQGSLPPDTYTF